MRMHASYMVLLGALAGGCLPAQQPKSRHYDPLIQVLQKVPEKARAKNNPFQNDPEAAAAGGKLFEQHCAECHGQMAEGGKRGPSLEAEELQHARPGEIFWILTNGIVRRGMPSWSKLPEPQRWQIIMFLQSLNGPEPRSHS